MSLTAFRTSVRRHGLVRVLERAVLGRAARVVEFEICRVESTMGQTFAWPDVTGYETRMTTEAEFHQHLCDELSGVDYRWAFARGDHCAASFHGDEIVGYTFNTFLPTRVRAGLTFTFPPECVYAFASATAPSHRGRHLEQDRWKAAQRYRIAIGRNAKHIWYVNVINLEIRATTKAVGLATQLIGYLAYANISGRYRCFASPGCRRAGIVFSASSTP